jgi:hypothetical protein
MSTQYIDPLNQLIDLQNKISHIHTFLEKAFPIAIADADHFLIYEYDRSCRGYTFIKQAGVPMPIPAGVRAAFPLESLDNRIACVVSGDVFESLEGFVTIFHEFIHCQQFEICESELKRGLGIAQKAQAARNFMWELDHPFPYQLPEFNRLYSSYLTKALRNNRREILHLRRQLKESLTLEDYEYMLWEEWKEGFARFIENRIKQSLNLPENHNGQDPPYTRLSFYEGGARFIETICLFDPGLSVNIENLFKQMFLE